MYTSERLGDRIDYLYNIVTMQDTSPIEAYLIFSYIEAVGFGKDVGEVPSEVRYEKGRRTGKNLNAPVAQALVRDVKHDLHSP